MRYIHAVVARHNRAGQHHEVCQRLGAVLRFLANTPVVHAVAIYAVVILGSGVALRQRVPGEDFGLLHGLPQGVVASLASQQFVHVRDVALERQLSAYLGQLHHAHAFSHLVGALRHLLGVAAAHVVIVGDNIKVCAGQAGAVITCQPLACAHGVGRGSVAHLGHVVAVLFTLDHKNRLSGFNCRKYLWQLV